MNIFTNLLSLHGYVTDPHLFGDEREERYASELGNRVAAKRFFGSLGHARRDESALQTEQRAVEGCG